jgi:small subunit ribosomal protein S1
MDETEKKTENDVEQPGSEEQTSLDKPVWFQDFVEHYDVDKPQQGEILKGSILDIQENSILLDVGFKRDAIIPSQDLDRVNPEYLSNLAVGNEVYVSIIRTPLGDDDLLVSLSKGLAHKTWLKAEELAEKDEVIELEIVDQNKGGLLVAYENIRGFIPNSHIPTIRKGTSTQKAGEIKSEMIGKVLPLKFIEVNTKERRLVFSARGALKDQRKKRIKEIEIGETYTSRIVNVVDFGLFVDLDGVDGLVHKSEIDWERISNPKKMFKIGDEIEIKVVGIDKDKERVSLSRKALLPNPWLKLADKYSLGDLVEGIVVSVLDFGAFVELPEGLQGLVHVSELGYLSTEDPKSTIKKGDPVLVKIMGIDPERERVSLSMRRVPVSEQMDWMMNLEEVTESDKLDTDSGDPGNEDDDPAGPETTSEDNDDQVVPDKPEEETPEMTESEDQGEEISSNEEPEIKTEITQAEGPEVESPPEDEPVDLPETIQGKETAE